MTKTMLIIEDNLSFRECLEYYFEDMGYSILAAANGRYALYFIDDYTIDVCISDYMIPYFTGLEIYKEFSKKFPESVFILMSGCIVENRPIEVPFISKPFDLEELNDIINMYIEER